jgi:hypothetical protein
MPPKYQYFLRSKDSCVFWGTKLCDKPFMYALHVVSILG